MLLAQLIALTELVELLEREAPFLTHGEHHDRLMVVLQAIARMHDRMGSHVDAQIDQLVLRACNTALDAMYPAAIAGPDPNQSADLGAACCTAN